MNFPAEFKLLSEVIMIPVLLVLLFLLVWSLLELGGFARECLERRRRRAAWDDFSKRLRAAEPHEARAAAESFFRTDEYPGFVKVFALRGRELYRNPVHLAKLVTEIEIEAAHGQARMNLGVRLGPAFGLVGTIIPMGPALSGLSSGNVGIIAGNLSVAFGTTIIGLLISALCYFISIGRRHWYARDISDVEYVCEFLHHDHEVQK